MSKAREASMNLTDGERIRRERRMAEITQSELAEAVGVKQQTIAQYESGRIRLSLEVARKIAKALDVKVADLFDLKQASEGGE